MLVRLVMVCAADGVVFVIVVGGLMVVVVVDGDSW